MNDTGNSMIPLADPLFASGLRLGAQVASVEETHVISPAILNTFRAGIFAGGVQLRRRELRSVPAGYDISSQAASRERSPSAAAVSPRQAAT